MKKIAVECANEKEQNAVIAYYEKQGLTQDSLTKKFGYRDEYPIVIGYEKYVSTTNQDYTEPEGFMHVPFVVFANLLNIELPKEVITIEMCGAICQVDDKGATFDKGCYQLSPTELTEIYSAYQSLQGE